jgi:hypothetical protein
MTPRSVVSLLMAVVTMGMLDGTPASAECCARCASEPYSHRAEQTPVAAIRTTGSFESTLRRMLEASPTFRRQLTRIVSDGTFVVTVEPCVQCPRGTDGQTHLTIKTGYLSRAIVQIKLRDIEKIVETVGHEFEHILEQLDGVDLGRLVRSPRHAGHGILREPTGHYETERARHVGLTVGREYRAHAAAARQCQRAQP